MGRPLFGSGIAVALLVLCLAVVFAVPVLASEGRVRLQDGLVSAVFDATPTADAFEAVRRATGVAVPVPPSAREKTLTLAVEQVPFEVFMRRLHEALDLGGFALQYGSGGAPDRLFMVEKGRGPEVPTPPAEAWRRVTAEAGRGSVPFLMRKTDADSIKLGAPGQVIVVESPPFAKTTTSECYGSPGRYPVQTVLVTDAVNTYIAAIVVCVPEGLTPGQTLTPARGDQRDRRL